VLSRGVGCDMRKRRCGEGKRMVSMRGEVGCYSWDFDVYYNAWRLVTLSSFASPSSCVSAVVSERQE
jgi:hypothetical protein